MVTLEEMTRRRDHWRQEAQLLGEQLQALQTRFDQVFMELGAETDRRTAAQAEAAANLKWVRALQRMNELLKLELKQR